jgi:hypothetical protein
MGEKILGEIRFIETEDGFRLEFKGDKERFRKRGFGPGWFGSGFGPGPEFGHGPHGRHQGWHRGPWKHGHFGGFGPCSWVWDYQRDDLDEEDSGEKPPKDL